MLVPFLGPVYLFHYQLSPGEIALLFISFFLHSPFHSLSVTLSLCHSLSLSLSLIHFILFHFNSLFTFSFLLCLLFREIMTEFPNVYSQKPFTLSTNPSLSRLEQMQRYMSGFLGQIRIRKQKADILYNITLHPLQLGYSRFVCGDSDFFLV